MSAEVAPKRVFVAVDLTADVLPAVAAAQAELRGLPLFSGRLTRPENLHLTLKFLGEQPPERIAEVAAALASVSMPPFRATLAELGVFSARRQMSIVWIHVAGAEMLQLQRAVDAALTPWFEPERRFMSHLTIARVKGIKQRHEFADEVTRIRLPAVELTVEQFALKQSDLAASGPTYTDLNQYPLAPAP